ncbi:MAG: DUF86 domain-containing protein [Anaerolineae bacterium]|nr:DUF86 domain-containing protein [Anaerolineae bacterium]
MLDMARNSQKLVEGKTREDLDNDLSVSLSVVRALQIVGEAARKISPQTQTDLPQIPWSSMIGMRNKIVHDYTDIDHQIVWDTIMNDLPPLITLLEEILESEDDGEDTTEDHAD